MTKRAATLLLTCHNKPVGKQSHQIIQNTQDLQTILIPPQKQHRSQVFLFLQIVSLQLLLLPLMNQWTQLLQTVQT